MITHFYRKPAFWLFLFASILPPLLAVFFLIDTLLGVSNFQITYSLIILASILYPSIVQFFLTRWMIYDIYYDATSLLLARSQVVMVGKGALAEAGAGSKTLFLVRDIDSLTFHGAILAASFNLKDGRHFLLIFPYTFSDFDGLFKELEGKGVRIVK